MQNENLGNKCIQIMLNNKAVVRVQRNIGTFYVNVLYLMGVEILMVNC
jgi:hypothetical protein